MIIDSCASLFVGSGSDVAGEVVQAGSSVKKFKTGDKVVAILSHAVSCFVPGKPYQNSFLTLL